MILIFILLIISSIVFVLIKIFFNNNTQEKFHEKFISNYEIIQAMKDIVNPISNYYNMINKNQKNKPFEQADFNNVLNYSKIVYAYYINDLKYIEHCHKNSFIEPLKIFQDISNYFNSFDLTLLFDNPNIENLYKKLTQEEINILDKNNNSRNLLNEINGILNIKNF